MLTVIVHALLFVLFSAVLEWYIHRFWMHREGLAGFETFYHHAVEHHRDGGMDHDHVDIDWRTFEFPTR